MQRRRGFLLRDFFPADSLLSSQQIVSRLSFSLSLPIHRVTYPNARFEQHGRFVSVLRENVWVKSRVDGVFSLEAFQVGGNFFFAGNFEYRRSNELTFGTEFVWRCLFISQLGKSGNLKNRLSFVRKCAICLIKFLCIFSSFIFVRNQTRVQRCLINVKKYYYYFCDIYDVYLFYEKRKRKDICYVKIMLGRGLTDYGKSMALCSMEYWYQWINENKSFIFRILFSAQF